MLGTATRRVKRRIFNIRLFSRVQATKSRRERMTDQTQGAQNQTSKPEGRRGIAKRSDVFAPVALEDRRIKKIRYKIRAIIYRLADYQ